MCVIVRKIGETFEIVQWEHQSERIGRLLGVIEKKHVLPQRDRICILILPSLLIDYKLNFLGYSVFDYEHSFYIIIFSAPSLLMTDKGLYSLLLHEYLHLAIPWENTLSKVLRLLSEIDFDLKEGLNEQNRMIRMLSEWLSPITWKPFLDEFIDNNYELFPERHIIEFNEPDLIWVREDLKDSKYFGLEGCLGTV